MIDTQAKRIFDLSRSPQGVTVRAPKFDSIDQAAHWLREALDGTPHILEEYRSELDTPFVKHTTDKATTEIFVLNQQALSTTKEVIIYCPSFTSIVNEGYTQILFASLAKEFGIPIISYHYPLYKGCTVTDKSHNKLISTAELVASFCAQYLARGTRINFVGNSQGGLVGALTAKHLNDTHPVSHVIALDPPTLKPGTSWDIFWRGIKDAGDYHQRIHFPFPVHESWDVVQDVYGGVLDRLKALTDYAQKVFANGRLSYLKDISHLEILSELKHARAAHPEMYSHVVYGSHSRITGKDITEHPEVDSHIKDSTDGRLQFYGVPGGTHAMLVNASEFLLFIKRVVESHTLSETLPDSSL